MTDDDPLARVARAIFERNAAGQYVKVVGATVGRVDPVPGCEGLAIDLDTIWAELSRLGE